MGGIRAKLAHDRRRNIPTLCPGSGITGSMRRSAIFLAMDIMGWR
jgi:hypothetical protein